MRIRVRKKKGTRERRLRQWCPVMITLYGGILEKDAPECYAPEKQPEGEGGSA